MGTIKKVSDYLVCFFCLLLITMVLVLIFPSSASAFNFGVNEGTLVIVMTGIAAIGLFFVFLWVFRKPGSSALLWWIFTSMVVGVASKVLSPIVDNIIGIGGGVLTWVITGLVIFLNGFISLLIIAILNAIFYRKWGVRLSPPK